jgi:hypothetical protein
LEVLEQPGHLFERGFRQGVQRHAAFVADVSAIDEVKQMVLRFHQ